MSKSNAKKRNIEGDLSPVPPVSGPMETVFLYNWLILFAMSFRASKGWWLTSSTWVALVCTLPSSNDLETMCVAVGAEQPAPPPWSGPQVWWHTAAGRNAEVSLDWCIRSVSQIFKYVTCWYSIFMIACLTCSSIVFPLYLQKQAGRLEIMCLVYCRSYP